jgi:hypothetical protein
MRIEIEVAPHFGNDPNAGAYIDGAKLTLLFEGFAEGETFSTILHGAKSEEEAYRLGLDLAAEFATRFINSGFECAITRADVKALKARKAGLMKEFSEIEDELNRLGNN